MPTTAKNAIESISLTLSGEKFRKNPLTVYIETQSFPYADFNEIETVQQHIETVIDHLKTFWVGNWETSEFVKKLKWCPQMFADAACYISAENGYNITKTNFQKKGSPCAIGFVVAVDNALKNICAPIVFEQMKENEFKKLLKKIINDKLFQDQIEKQFNDALSEIGYHDSINE